MRTDFMGETVGARFPKSKCLVRSAHVSFSREADVRNRTRRAICGSAVFTGCPLRWARTPGMTRRGGGVFSQFLQLTLAGVAQGCVYALVALGFVLIYKATETVNFAQGDLMMLGAFFGLTASTVLGWPYWATILFAIIVMAAGRHADRADRDPPGARLSDLHGGDDHDRRRLRAARRRHHGAGLGHRDLFAARRRSATR